MALTQINSYSNIGNSDVDNLMLSNNKLFIGHDKLTLTHMGDTTVPAIAEGSVFEIGGALFQAAAEESISTTDPHTSTTVADGTVYIFINGSTGLAYFTATAPTWDDTKQGYYGTSTYANYRYVPVAMTKATTSYSDKYTLGTIYGPIDRFSLVEEITGTSDADASTDVAYPTGYTSANTHVMACKINTSGGYVVLGSDANFSLVLGASNMTIFHADSGFYSQTYKLLVGRLD